MSRERRSFTPEFKLEAASLVVDQNYSIPEACRALDLGESALRRWVKQLEAERGGTTPSSKALTPEQQRIKELEARVKRLEQEKFILKSYLLREASKIKRYEFMLTNSALHSIVMMARVLLVSRSGYYSWLDNREMVSWRMQQRESIDALVKAAFEAGKGRYGAERIFYDLAEQDNPLDIKTIRKSLKRQGLIAKAAKLFKVTTDSNHSLPVAPNLLARDFSAQQPNEKWVTDITYIQTTEGWLYLAVMIDLYSRKIVGWSMSKHIDAQLVCDALTMALWRRKFPKGVIVHSDRGSQYASHAFRGLLEKYSLTQSMSRKGDCWDTQPTILVNTALV